MRCGGCQKKIKGNEPRMTFQKQAGATVMIFHSCCYQEFLLAEIWGALTIGTKYQSGCQHSDKTSQFNPVELTPEEIIKAIEDAVSKHQGPKPGDVVGGRYLLTGKPPKDN